MVMTMTCSDDKRKLIKQQMLDLDLKTYDAWVELALERLDMSIKVHEGVDE